MLLLVAGAFVDGVCAVDSGRAGGALFMATCCGFLIAELAVLMSRQSGLHGRDTLARARLAEDRLDFVVLGAKRRLVDVIMVI